TCVFLQQLYALVLSWLRQWNYWLFVAPAAAGLTFFLAPLFLQPSVSAWPVHLQSVLVEYYPNFAVPDGVHSVQHILQPLYAQHLLQPAAASLKIRRHAPPVLQLLFRDHGVAVPVSAFLFLHRPSKNQGNDCLPLYFQLLQPVPDFADGPD